MSNSGKKYWFRVVAGKDMESNYLLYATCEKAVRQLFKGKVQIKYVGRASWRSMVQLTGCVKPPSEDFNDSATGFLIFNCNSQVTILHPDLAEGIR